jgi:hypothetical protein
VRHQRVEDLGGEPAGGAHAGEAFGPCSLMTPLRASLRSSAATVIY